MIREKFHEKLQELGEIASILIPFAAFVAIIGALTLSMIMLFAG